MMRLGLPDEQPDLNTALSECLLRVYKLGSPINDKTWAWFVLVPREWEAVEGQGNRPRVDTGSGRHWYDGFGVSERDARRQACDILGRALGKYLAAWMGPQQPPIPERLPGIRQIGDYHYE